MKAPHTELNFQKVYNLTIYLLSHALYRINTVIVKIEEYNDP